MDRMARPMAGVSPAYDPIAVPDLDLRMVSDVAAAAGFGGVKCQHNRDGDGEQGNQTADAGHETARGETFRILLL
jgi:hypothetical protein